MTVTTSKDDSTKTKDTRLEFDHVFDSSSSSVEDIFTKAVAPLVGGLFQGYNATVAACGAQQATGRRCCIDSSVLGCCQLLFGRLVRGPCKPLTLPCCPPPCLSNAPNAPLPLPPTLVCDLLMTLSFMPPPSPIRPPHFPHQRSRCDQVWQDLHPGVWRVPGSCGTCCHRHLCQRGQ